LDGEEEAARSLLALTNLLSLFRSSPLFRERHRPDMTEAEAEALLKEALAVCFYRDKQSINKFQIAKVTAGGEGGKGKAVISVSDPFALETTWDYAAFINPSAHAKGTW